MATKLNNALIHFFATGFYLGRIPFAPGTFGTLAALPLIWFFWQFDLGVRLLATVALTLFGVWISDLEARISGRKDPSHVVIDEMAGYMVAMLLFPFELLPLVLAFVLFRIFDILKPFPIKRLEALPGGWGIMLDDIGAGVVALGLLTLGFYLFT